MFNSMFDQVLRFNKELASLVDYIQKSGVTIKEGDNYSYLKNVITLDTFDKDDIIMYSLLHEYGHHLQKLDPSFSSTWCKYFEEQDAWDRGQLLYKHLFNKDIPQGFHELKDSCLKTYLKLKGRSIYSYYLDKEYEEGIVPASTTFVLPKTKESIEAEYQVRIAAIQAEYEATVAAINAKYGK